MTASVKPAKRSTKAQTPKTKVPTPRAARAAKRTALKADQPLQNAHQPTPSIEPSIEPATRKPPAGKLGIVVALLSRPEGATIAQLGEATAWQPHSVRGALAGALKKKHGLTVTSEKTDAGRVYRLGGGCHAGGEDATPLQAPAGASGSDVPA